MRIIRIIKTLFGPPLATLSQDIILRDLIETYSILHRASLDTVYGPTAIWAFADHASKHIDAQIEKILRSK